MLAQMVRSFLFFQVVLTKTVEYELQWSGQCGISVASSKECQNAADSFSLLADRKNIEPYSMNFKEAAPFCVVDGSKQLMFNPAGKGDCSKALTCICKKAAATTTAATTTTTTTTAMTTTAATTAATTADIGFTCSNGVRGSFWTEYLDRDWKALGDATKTTAACWAAVKATFPAAEGFMVITDVVCRVMTDFQKLEPTNTLAATYPDYQGTGAICVKAAPVDTTTTTTTTTAASTTTTTTTATTTTAATTTTTTTAATTTTVAVMNHTWQQHRAGHCSQGWLGFTGSVTDLDSCGNKCSSDDSCGYFAYRNTDLKCATYTQEAGCPDDFRFPDYNVYIMSRAELPATARGSFELIRKGHCSTGWMRGFNSFKSNLNGCADACGREPRCRYFAHLDANCSQYMWTETGIHNMSELQMQTFATQPVAAGTISSGDLDVATTGSGLESMLAAGLVVCKFTNCALYTEQDRCADHSPISAHHKYKDYNVYVLKAENELRYAFTLQHWTDYWTGGALDNFTTEEVHKGHCASGWKQGKNIVTNGSKYHCVMWGYMHMEANFIAFNAKTGLCSLYTESTCEDDNRYPNFTSYKLTMPMHQRRAAFEATMAAATTAK